jgi:hypothetical protein
MDESKIRSELIEWDNKTLEDRVARWKQIQPATYVVSLPNLVWEYLVETDYMFIRGHDVATILLCATALELVIAHRLKLLKNSPWNTELKFVEMIKLARENQIVNDIEASGLNGLRELRNALTHGSISKLDKMARKNYEGFGVYNENIGPSLYLHSIGSKGIDVDALKYLQLTRDLTLKFYGEPSGK